MPCYRCGARQADPARGLQPWLRAVRLEQQVLVCPDCQQNHAWPTDMDHCATCGSTRLVRRLGTTVCRDCEDSATQEFLAVEMTMDTGVSRRDNSGRHRRQHSPELSADVAQAIERVLGRHAARVDASAVGEPGSDPSPVATPSDSVAGA